MIIAWVWNVADHTTWYLLSKHAEFTALETRCFSANINLAYSEMSLGVVLEGSLGQKLARSSQMFGAAQERCCEMKTTARS